MEVAPTAGHLNTYAGIIDDYRPSLASMAATEQFVTGVPGTSAVLDEHLDDNEGQMLPHLLMADPSRWFVAAVAAGDTAAVVAFLIAVELLYMNEDSDIRDVAGVSFAEHLVASPDPSERAAFEAARRLGGTVTVRDLTALNAYFKESGTTEQRP